MARPGPFALPLILLVAASASTGQEAAPRYPLSDYFETEVARIEAKPLAEISSAEEWKAHRSELQRQLRDMLGLDPLPEHTDLKVVVTGVVERPDFLVENLHFQSLPGLYVTANLYRPREGEGKRPAVLYVCGHGKVEKDGVIYGNKTHYQHHAAWYAANGFVCLVLDTLQLGEVPGLHHGTNREGRWWWQSRGYTPAGIETWNGIRGLDYLVSRPDVDPARLGVSGRSGGGATSWWLGAVDDRLKCVIPVAGITDLRNHLIKGGEDGRYPNGCIDGHCDCMYFVNTYRWDFDTLAALVAPKALLLENTDLDPIFPIDGVKRLHAKLEKVYGWYGEPGKLGLTLDGGGHQDTPALRHAEFAFMKKWLQGEEVAVADIDEPDRKIPVEELKVLPVGAPLPAGQINDRVDEVFVPRAGAAPVPKTSEQWETLRSRWIAELQEKVFGGWPDPSAIGPAKLEMLGGVGSGRITSEMFMVESQPGVSVLVGLVGAAEPARRVDVAVRLGPNPFPGHDSDASRDPGHFRASVQVRGQPEPEQPPILPARYLAPSWPPDLDASIRRRFALIGQTLDGQRVWDLRRAIQALQGSEKFKEAEFHLVADSATAPLAVWAAAFELEIRSVRILDALPSDPKAWPAMLNVDRVLTPAQALGLLYPRPVLLPAGTNPDDWAWAFELGRNLRPATPWPSIAGTP